MCVGRMMIHKPKIFMIESLHYRQHELGILDILFSSNHNIHKSSSDHCFWASDHLIDGFYLNHSIKWSEAQKQRSDELLWMLWFDEKSISNVSYIFQLSLLERMSGIPIFSTTKSHFASALLSVIPSGGSGYQGDEKEI